MNPEVPSYIKQAIAKQDSVVEIIDNSVNRIRATSMNCDDKNRIMEFEKKNRSKAERLAEQIRSEFDIRPKYKRARMNLWLETKLLT